MPWVTTAWEQPCTCRACQGQAEGLGRHGAKRRPEPALDRRTVSEIRMASAGLDGRPGCVPDLTGTDPLGNRSRRATRRATQRKTGQASTVSSSSAVFLHPKTLMSPMRRHRGTRSPALSPIPSSFKLNNSLNGWRSLRVLRCP